MLQHVVGVQVRKAYFRKVGSRTIRMGVPVSASISAVRTMREELVVAHGVLAASLVVLRLTLHFVTLGDGGGALALFQVPRVRARVRHRKLLHVN